MLLDSRELVCPRARQCNRHALPLAQNIAERGCERRIGSACNHGRVERLGTGSWRRTAGGIYTVEERETTPGGVLTASLVWPDSVAQPDHHQASAERLSGKRAKRVKWWSGVEERAAKRGAEELYGDVIQKILPPREFCHVRCTEACTIMSCLTWGV
jgi:hypothetical protein